MKQDLSALTKLFIITASGWHHCGAAFDIEEKKQSLAKKKDQMSHDPDFWLSAEKSGVFLKELKRIEKFVAAAESLKSLDTDLEAALELAKEDSAFMGDLVALLQSHQELLTQLELENFLSGPLDRHDALLTIQAGAGGTESCDWAAMLRRMYERFAQKQGWQCQEVSFVPGEAAGIKSIENRDLWDYGVWLFERRKRCA